MVKNTHMRVKKKKNDHMHTHKPHLQAMGTDAVAIKADMSNPAEVEALFKETAAAFSDPVSILVRMRTTTRFCVQYRDPNLNGPPSTHLTRPTNLKTH